MERRCPSFADPEEYEYVGPFIGQLRKEMDLSQNDISDTTGFSIQTVSKFEHGKIPLTGIAAKAIMDCVLGYLEDNSLENVMNLFDDYIETTKGFSVPIMDS